MFLFMRILSCIFIWRTNNNTPEHSYCTTRFSLEYSCDSAFVSKILEYLPGITISNDRRKGMIRDDFFQRDSCIVGYFASVCDYDSLSCLYDIVQKPWINDRNIVSGRINSCNKRNPSIMNQS